MLQRSTVTPDTLALLKELMAMPVFGDYYLVGGTALALQIGHRNSVDLDLFCDLTWNPEAIMDSLPQPFERTAASNVFQGYFIRGVKCDFVRNLYPRQLPLIIDEGVRMASPLEIAAMKFMAITNRGKKKDFIDLYFLLQMFSIKEIFDFFHIKYPQVQPFMVMRSLCYFEDAEMDENPIMLKKADWKTIKKKIQDEVVRYGN